VCSGPGFVSVIDEVVDVRVRRDYKLRQVLDVRTKQRVFTDSQPRLVLWVEQVTNVFTVDLHVTDLDHTRSACWSLNTVGYTSTAHTITASSSPSPHTHKHTHARTAVYD